MADANYRRLVAACDHEKPLFPTTGKPRKACFGCWPGAGPKERAAARARRCRGCDAEVGPKRHWCAACLAAHIKQRRAGYGYPSKPRAVLCQHCYRYKVRAVSGKPEDARFCDWYCAAAHRSKVAQEVAAIRRLAPARTQENRPAAIRALVRALRCVLRDKQRQQSLEALARTPCVMCGKPCGYAFGRPRSYCSEACAWKSEPARNGRRVRRLKQKAKKRGATVEAVNPLRVFARDRWRCQLCGMPTPARKRGTMQPDAPELDHIIPLAKGGSHSYINTQCACRRCNGLKSDRPQGQLLLIG